MYMPYTTNPHMPRVRRDAVNYAHAGRSIRDTARRFGVHPSTVLRWLRRAPRDGRILIATVPSTPHQSPRALDPELVRTIVAYRKQYHGRCAFFLHHMLQRDGVRVSLSSVKRTLVRNELTKFSKWKKWHIYPPRPLPQAPGILVELDTIHDGPSGAQLYIYTLLDVFS